MTVVADRGFGYMELFERLEQETARNLPISLGFKIFWLVTLVESGFPPATG